MKFRNWLVLLFLFTSQSIYAAVSSEVSRSDYVGSGSVASYSTTFPCKAVTELRVFVQDANGQDVELFYGGGYSAVINGSGLVTITLTAGNLTNGYKISLQRGIPYTQTTTPGAAYNATTIGTALDRLQNEIVRLKGDVDRAIKIPYLEAGGDSVTKVDDNPANRAGKGLAFDNDGNVYAGAPLASATVSAFMQTVLDDTSAAAARSTLGPYGDALATATGTTTARTLADRFADVLNVKDFGAIGDGVANDTAEIQAAIDQCNSLGGGVVYIPEGIYLLSSGGVEMKSGVALVGVGNDVSIIRGPDFLVGSYSRVDNVRVENLGFDCTTVPPGYVDSFPIYFLLNSNISPLALASTNIVIRGNRIIYGATSAIMVVNAYDVQILDNVIESCGENGIEVQAHVDAAKFNRNLFIRGNTVVNWGRVNSGAGIVLFGRNQGVIVSENVVTGDNAVNCIRGILFEDENFPTVTLGSLGVCGDNEVRGASIGIQDAGCRMFITGNTIEDCTVEGIYTESSACYAVGNRVVVSDPKLALGQGLMVRAPRNLRNNIVTAITTTPEAGENLCFNGDFLNLPSATAIPAPWSDDAGVLGAVAPTTVGPGAAAPPEGHQTLQVVAAAGGVARVRQIADADTLAKVAGRLYYVSCWVKASAATKCRLGLRTSDGDSWGAYNVGTEWERLEIAVFVGSASTSATILLETAISATVQWAGVKSGLTYGNPGPNRDSVRPYLYSANPSVVTKDGTFALVNNAGTYRLAACINGSWHFVNLTP